MARLDWSKNIGLYESGLDRGVLYPGSSKAVAWNGLISVEESYNGEDSQAIYVDGTKVLDTPIRPEFSATLTALTYPDEFLPYTGYQELYSGAFVGEQSVEDVFHISYRTLINGGPHYKIHLIFNLTAIPDDLERSTHESEIDPIEFKWKLSSVPVDRYSSHKNPFSHVIFDSRILGLGSITLRILEEKIYGSEKLDSNIETIFDFIKNLDDSKYKFIIIESTSDNWTLLGPDDKINEVNGIFSIDGIRFTDNGDGTYKLIDDLEA